VKLSTQAVKVLEELKSESPKSVEKFENDGYDQSMVNRAGLELEEEGLVNIEEETEISYSLTEEGEKVLENGSPEHQLIERVKDGSRQMSELQELDLNIALGKAREKNWVEIDSGEVYITEEGEKNLDTDPVKIRLEKENFSEKDSERGLVEEKSRKLRTLVLTDKGEEIDINEVVEKFNVEASVKTPRIGKKHFYKEITDYARRTWLEMGFEEMGGSFVVPSLLNFDALYTPQDHPAREMHDTFFLKNPEKADLSEYGDKVDHIKQTHKNGWKTGSTGYGRDWLEEEAAKNVLRTHTTAVSARRLHEIDINEEELPKKLFIVGRNFRNETVDRTHLAGFIQTDGIVVGKDLNFKNLKGYISEFFERMGYEKFRIIPSYYPYTEMSAEVQVWDEEEEAWLGAGGSGLFRPEVVKPLLGFEATVLAWGLGVPRIAMKAAGIDDIRELYRNDIELLEETPVWRPE